MNQFTGCVAPLDVDKDKLVKTEKLRKSSASTCVIIPPKTFRILVKPLHEFQGHSDDILDLAWSKSGVSFLQKQATLICLTLSSNLLIIFSFIQMELTVVCILSFVAVFTVILR